MRQQSFMQNTGLQDKLQLKKTPNSNSIVRKGKSIPSCVYVRIVMGDEYGQLSS